MTRPMKSFDDKAGSPPAAGRVARSELRVRYADTDKMGVVYYANYLVWFEVGRTDWLRQAGFTYRELEESGIVLPVVETRCEYRQPARYDDDIEVRTRGTLLSGVRVRFDYEIVRRQNDAIAACGHTVHASISPGGRLTRLPEQVRRLFT